MTELEVEGLAGGVLFLRGTDGSIVRVNVAVQRITCDETEEPAVLWFTAQSVGGLKRVRQGEK